MSVLDDSPPPAAVPPADPPAAAPPLLTVRGAAAGFGGPDVIAGIDLDVRAGETVAILGRSGGGKTTLLHLLAGLIAPTAGSVRAEPAALMPQRDGLMPWASATANAALPLRIAGVARREARGLAAEQLRALGLAGAEERRVRVLSGGMRQRVALARTLLTGRRLLLLDEPLAAVDALTRDELHGLLLAHLRSGDRGAVLVTHDLDEAVRLADRLLVLRGAPGGPRGLAEGPVLLGRPGDRLAHRGGDALRAQLMEALGV